MSDYTRKAMAEARHQMHNYRSPILAQSDAGPDASAGLIEAAEITDDEVEVCFEAASIAERNGATFSGYIRAALEKFMELRSRAADRSVHGELMPDCPTDGVAARQGNGG